MRLHAEQIISTTSSSVIRTIALLPTADRCAAHWLDLSGAGIMTPCLNMIARSLQLFFLAFIIIAATAAAAAELQTGAVHQLIFRDVDGQDLSTAAGHVTVITVITRENGEEARAVSRLMPERCTGDPKYRYVTLVNFQGKLPGPVRGFTRAVIRKRLDAEANKLKPRYAAKDLTRDPRRDVYVVADFDGGAVARLGLSPESTALGVFVFDGKGKLVARWSEVPSEEAMISAIAAAD